MPNPDHLAHAVGLLAAAATICAFCCRDILRLRAAALLANVLFIAYGALLMLLPVLALHLVLLPLNTVRLAAVIRERKDQKVARPALRAGAMQHPS
jgi:hypothetical protein